MRDGGPVVGYVSDQPNIGRDGESVPCIFFVIHAIIRIKPISVLVVNVSLA